MLQIFVHFSEKYQNLEKYVRKNLKMRKSRKKKVNRAGELKEFSKKKNRKFEILRSGAENLIRNTDFSRGIRFSGSRDRIISDFRKIRKFEKSKKTAKKMKKQKHFADGWRSRARRAQGLRLRFVPWYHGTMFDSISV